MDFRLFLLRHTALLQALYRWTIRLVIPRQFSAARLAYLHAAREHLATPIPASTVESLQCLFEQRRSWFSPRRTHLTRIAKATTAGSVRRAFGPSIASGWTTLRTRLYLARSPLLADAMERQNGRVESVELSRQYLHLSPLVGVA